MTVPTVSNLTTGPVFEVTNRCSYIVYINRKLIRLDFGLKSNLQLIVEPSSLRSFPTTATAQSSCVFTELRSIGVWIIRLSTFCFLGNMKYNQIKDLKSRTLYLYNYLFLVRAFVAVGRHKLYFMLQTYNFFHNAINYL